MHLLKTIHFFFIHIYDNKMRINVDTFIYFVSYLTVTEYKLLVNRVEVSVTYSASKG